MKKILVLILALGCFSSRGGVSLPSFYVPVPTITAYSKLNLNGIGAGMEIRLMEGNAKKLLKKYIPADDLMFKPYLSLGLLVDEYSMMKFSASYQARFVFRQVNGVGSRVSFFLSGDRFLQASANLYAYGKLPFSFSFDDLFVGYVGVVGKDLDLKNGAEELFKMINTKPNIFIGLYYNPNIVYRSISFNVEFYPRDMVVFVGASQEI